MKRKYDKPTINVVSIQHQGIICTSANKTINNAGFNETISGGSGDARASSFDDWDDDWDE